MKQSKTARMLGTGLSVFGNSVIGATDEDVEYIWTERWVVYARCALCKNHFPHVGRKVL